MTKTIQKKSTRPENSYSGLVIQKIGVSSYGIYTIRGIQVGAFLVPDDGQWIRDHKLLVDICEKLSARLGVMNKKGVLAREVSYKGLNYRQTGVSTYEIFFCTEGGYSKAGIVRTPPDYRYDLDRIVLSQICKALAERYY